ncbi:MAG: tRNA 2-thiocytidine(32) synthetase TtcA [Myxococcota bacterium]
MPEAHPFPTEPAAKDRADPRATEARLERRLARDLGRCVRDFALIEAGDRVMVCVSGGKDSYTLLELLTRAQRRAPVPFELVAVHLDQGHPGYDGSSLRAWLEAQGHAHHMLREDTYSIVKKRVPAGKTTCSLCSRLRRGVLYRVAEELGCTKIALGHHRDDALETLLLNLFFAGSLGAMPPKLVSNDGRHVVIRPLLYAAEADIASYARLRDFPILPCDLCGSQPDLWRQHVKDLLADLEGRIPGLRNSMLAALGHVRPRHLLDLKLAAAHPVAQGDLEGFAAAVSTIASAAEKRAAGRRLPLASGDEA